MNTSLSGGARLRVALVGLLTGSLLLPAAALAAPGIPGTLVGTVRCGGQAAPLSNVSVAVEGADVSTRTVAGGKFVLAGVPAEQTFTVDAVDPSSPSVASRYNVSVEAGKTLDVGTLDLQVCPEPAVMDSSAPTAQSQEDMRDISTDDANQ